MIIYNKTLRRIDLSTAFAVAACKEALNDASIEISSENPKSVGIILGTGMGGAHLMIDQQRILEEKGPRRISPFLISHFLPDSATGIIAMELGVRGPNFAVTAACATGGTAIGEAAEIIARGEAEERIQSLGKLTTGSNSDKWLLFLLWFSN